MRVVTRRDFNRLLAASSACALAFHSASARDAPDAWLTEQVAEQSSVRMPGKTGLIVGEERQQLRTLYVRIGSFWQMDSTGGGDFEFTDLVDAKTSERPSYLTEYTEAAAILKRFFSKNGTMDGPIDVLLTQPENVPSFETTRLGRFQRYVSAEFISWWVTQGGFQRFGYVNYRGFMKGPFTDPSNPPFRTIY